jgi:hypothetical protein
MGQINKQTHKILQQPNVTTTLKHCTPDPPIDKFPTTTTNGYYYAPGWKWVTWTMILNEYVH